ncbi:MAG: glycosyltransferase [Bifidobacteriaceae bacterium]|nr:glycosyltransferase [Bifidobacteriaceae bacterium]
MATYNGEEFLKPQIESILNQKEVDVTLKICDDASADSSYQIAKDYSLQNTNIICSRNKENKGAAKNFIKMLNADDSQGYDYYAFSDQDDVWLPNKLIMAVKALSKTQSNPRGSMYFCDLLNVNKDLRPIERVLKNLDLSGFGRGTLLMRGWVHGCTLVFDAKLRNFAKSYEPTSYPRYHDSWIHMIAYYCGSTIISDTEHYYILRRITGSNAEGQTHFGFKNITDARHSFLRVFTNKPKRLSIFAQQLLIGFAQEMSPSDKRLVSAMAGYKHSIKKRLFMLFSPQFKSPTFSLGLVNRLKVLLGRY